jgi:hypothetical protein
MNDLSISSLMNRVHIKELNLPEGPYMFNNYYVPRVSTILSKMIHEDYLMTWANNMGLKGKRHTDISKIATDYGTEVHRRAEVLLGDDQEQKNQIIDLEDLSAYVALKDWIYNNNSDINVLYSELSLSCPYYGGTMDLVFKTRNDKIILLDFKTSKSVTYKYFLQLAAYEYMLRTQMGMNIDAVEILHLDKTKPEYTEYIIDLSCPGHRTFHEQNVESFLSLVYAYWNISRSEQMYNSIIRS